VAFEPSLPGRAFLPDHARTGAQTARGFQHYKSRNLCGVGFLCRDKSPLNLTGYGSLPKFLAQPGSHPGNRPVFLVSDLGAGDLAVGLIEGIAEFTALGDIEARVSGEALGGTDRAWRWGIPCRALR
jgi:hypothetical protein